MATPTPLDGIANPPAHTLLPPRPIDLSAPLNDLDAARLALITSPDLGAIRARAGVSQAQLFSAGLLPDPQLDASMDFAMDPGSLDAWTLGLAFDLSALVTRRARVASAREANAQARLDIAWEEWLAMNHARTLVRRIGSLERQVAVATQADDVARALFDASRRSMLRGDARIDDTSVYQVAWLDAHDRHLALLRQSQAAKQELNAVLGVPPDAVLKLAPNGELQGLAALDAAGISRAAVTDRLDLQALRLGYSAKEHDLQAATRLSWPLPQLSFNRARDNAGAASRGVGVSAALPLWNRNRGDIAVNTATRSQLAAEYRARVLQTRADVGTQVADLRAIENERDALADSIPTLEASASTMSNAVRNGDVALTTYETVRAALLDKKLALLALEQAQSEGEVALETAAGRLLWHEASPVAPSAH